MTRATARDYRELDFVNGAVGPELAQRRGMLRRARALLVSGAAPYPRGGPLTMATGDLPVPTSQRIHQQTRIVEAHVPSSTAGDLLPNNRRPSVWDGEPGAASPHTFEGFD